jgi:hypothetical protein
MPIKMVVEQERQKALSMLQELRTCGVASRLCNVVRKFGGFLEDHEIAEWCGTISDSCRTFSEEAEIPECVGAADMCKKAIKFLMLGDEELFMEYCGKSSMSCKKNLQMVMGGRPPTQVPQQVFA